MKIKQLDSGFKGLRKKNSPKTVKDDDSSRARAYDKDDSAAPIPNAPQTKAVNLKEGLTPQYVGYVERSLVPVLEKMGFTGDRLDLKNINNIKGLYSEIINSNPGNDMATAYAYLAVLLTWNGVTPNPKAMDEVPRPKTPEVKPSQRAYYRERLAICSECPEAFETMGRIRCGKCSCFMELKAFLKASQCPIKKW